MCLLTSIPVRLVDARPRSFGGPRLGGEIWVPFVGPGTGRREMPGAEGAVLPNPGCAGPVQSDSAAPLFWSDYISQWPLRALSRRPLCVLRRPSRFFPGPRGWVPIRLLGQEVGWSRDCSSLRGGDGIFPQFTSAGREWAEEWFVDLSNLVPGPSV